MADYDEEFPSPERFADDIHAAAEQGGEGVLRDSLTEAVIELDNAQHQLMECYVALDSVADDDLPDPVVEQLRDAQRRVEACAEWAKEAHAAVNVRRNEVFSQ